MVLWVLIIVGNLAWCMALLLVAYGFDIVVPSLSPESMMWIKRTFYFGIIIPVLFLLVAILLWAMPRIGLVHGVAIGALAVSALTFVGFFLWRFLKAIRDTQGEIRVQSNLIPEVRRIQFENRYRAFLILSIVVIVVTVLLMLFSVFFQMYRQDLQAEVRLVNIIVGSLVTLGFFIGTSYLFHATRSESLKLYGAPQPHEIGGFDSVRQQDEEIFA